MSQEPKPPKPVKRSRSPESEAESGNDDDDNLCIICLQRITDRTVLTCAHDNFCFDCCIQWTNQSRKCPLCSADIGTYVIHQVRSDHDYQKYYLPPLIEPASAKPHLQRQVEANVRRRRHLVQWGRRPDNSNAPDALDRAIEKRRWVYRNKLFAKHMASNPYTKYRPYPTPAQISGSEELMSRATAFIRRELQVWVNLDVQFLTMFLVSLLQRMDLRSETAVRAIAEFLDLGGEQYSEGAPKDNAEHFTHELYSFLRSPYRELSVYDSVVQYDRLYGAASGERHRRGELVQQESRGELNKSVHARRRSRERYSPAPQDKQFSVENPRLPLPSNVDRAPRDTVLPAAKRPHPNSSSHDPSPSRTTSVARRRPSLHVREPSSQEPETGSAIPKPNKHATVVRGKGKQRERSSQDRGVETDHLNEREDTTSSTLDNSHSQELSTPDDTPSRPILSIKNAAARARAHPTLLNSPAPSSSSSSETGGYVGSPSTDATSDTVSIVSPSSRPSAADFFGRRRLSRLAIDDGSNVNKRADAGTGVGQATASPSSGSLTPIEVDIKGSQVHVSSSQSHQHQPAAIATSSDSDARLRLLRARLVAGKELSRNAGTGINQDAVASPAAGGEGGLKLEPVSTTQIVTRTSTPASTTSPAAIDHTPTGGRELRKVVAPGEVGVGGRRALDEDRERESRLADVAESALRRLLMERRARAGPEHRGSASATPQ